MAQGTWLMDVTDTPMQKRTQSRLQETLVSGTFEDLNAWKKAMELVYDVYELTANFPKHETYGLSVQMRRAAVSIPSNIAEGKGRSTDKDFAHFLCQARGSLHELQTQIMIAAHLNYLSAELESRLLEKTRVVGRLLHGLLSFTKEHSTS